MKTKLVVVLFALSFFSSFSCKKDLLDATPILKGRLLSYYDSSPLSNATIKLYYTNGTPSSPDEVVTTDAMGYFNYKQVKDSLTKAIPALNGWWYPFESGYILYTPVAFGFDSIIYLFHQETVKVNVHFESPPDAFETGNILVQNLINLPELDTEAYFITDELIKMYTDTGTYVNYLSVVSGLDNTLSFSKEVLLGWNGGPAFEEVSAITFLADTTAGELAFDFYY